MRNISFYDSVMKKINLLFALKTKVLELMREVSTDQSPEDAEGEDVSDVSGYHSDSDSAVMASGNSPFVSKSARYNFLTRSGEPSL